MNEVALRAHGRAQITSVDESRGTEHDPDSKLESPIWPRISPHTHSPKFRGKKTRVKSTRNPRYGTAHRCGACLPAWSSGSSTAANAKRPLTIAGRRTLPLRATCNRLAVAQRTRTLGLLPLGRIVASGMWIFISKEWIAIEESFVGHCAMEATGCLRGTT